ncbi:MarR family winged helix-turn-helix transcriptional regulator [Cohnella mopanensis]|uniref:MarR family winged helix-turn-helix transcriptional regulator n=1 Tax=Cohnella mopanensis TaxID=2911966 RepID=UPI001EF7E242|nr:MarR family transcriptional regulator [Cohnella mopanensis]
MDDKELMVQANYIRTVVRKANRKFDKMLRDQVDPYGLTGPQVRILKELVEHPGLSTKDLCSRLHMTHSTVSGIADRLEKNQLVVRRKDEQDKRYIRIYVTDAVKSFVDDGIHDFVSSPLMEHLSQLSDIERELIIMGMKVLNKLSDSIK